ncbi:sigma factor-like helix-turn-helix DNA-binding protein [Gordonia sp. CPCC 206044]|uniref:sigma factor-like helix-turn-helix DNA-binding protein n=1 Tax=Gordonia sp. CPCC 206044 TaxID=3140793 RepID=UPI003AF3EE4E
MSPSSSEVLASTEATVPDDRQLAERLRGANLSDRPWIELLPWLAEYRRGPGILADDEIVVNAWIRSTPVDTLTDVNLERFCHRIAERYLADRATRRIIDDFPNVRPGTEPLPLPRAARDVLHESGVDTIARLMGHSAAELMDLPGIGPVTIVNLIARFVARSGVVHDVRSAADTTRSPGAPAELRVFVTSLTDRDRLVLHDRILASRPRTQSELAGMLGTSRERVTQIDRGLRNRLTSIVEDTPELRALSDEITRRADPVLDVETLVEEIPEMDTIVESVGIPTWRLLTAATPALVAADDWIVHGSLKESAALTRATVESCANPEDIAPAAEVANGLGLHLEAARRWLHRSGYSLIADHVISSTASTGDLVAAFLSTATTPQTFDQIIEGLVDFPRAPSSVRNALVTDDRIVKTDRNSYGLRRWGLQQYEPVHVQIDRILARADGPVPLSEVIDEITGRYDVTEASVRAYASAGDFVTRDDMVTRRRRPYAPRKSPTRTRGLYRDGDTVHWATTVTAAHVKGSAFNLPSALAGIVGIAPGKSVQLSSPRGPQTFMWVSVQARSGTIKRFITELGLSEGDPIFLDFGPDSFDVRSADVDASRAPTAQVLARLGRARRGRLSKSGLLTIVRDALWLPDDSDAASIVATLRHRKENELADLVVAATN